MNVITWHGAVLRLEQGRRLVQDPLWLTATDGADFTFDATAPELNHPALGSCEVEPGSFPGTVRFRNGSRFLTASAARRELTFEGEEGQAWETFLLIGARDVADLRHILAHRWRVRPSSQMLEKSDIRMSPGFRLGLGSIELDLTANLPLASHTRRHPAPSATASSYAPPPSFIIQPGDENASTIELADGNLQTLAPAMQVELIPRRAAPPADVPTREAFMRGTNCGYVLPPDEPVFVPPPMTARATDRDMFVRFLATNPGQSIGFVTGQCRIRRESNCFVALARHCEGLIFTPDGATTDMSMAADAPALPAAFTRRDNRIWIDRNVLADAPKLIGPLLVFYDGNLDDYAHWLTGAMPALDALTRHVPRSSRLLLPGSVSRLPRPPAAFDHREIMTLLGFNKLPATESSTDVVWVDDVIFVEKPDPASIPAEQLRDFRDRALIPLEGRGEPTKRFYLRPAGDGAATERNEVERFLALQGFEYVQLDLLGLDQQVELFHRAAMVVGAYGDGLCNLVFSPPGVKVLELMQDDAFRPEGWSLCNKLGHVHSFIACPAPGRGSKLVPELASFRNLFKTLNTYRL